MLRVFIEKEDENDSEDLEEETEDDSEDFDEIESEDPEYFLGKESFHRKQKGINQKKVIQESKMTEEDFNRSEFD